jgi:hypothetical protein
MKSVVETGIIVATILFANPDEQDYHSWLLPQVAIPNYLFYF